MPSWHAQGQLYLFYFNIHEFIQIFPQCPKKQDLFKVKVNLCQHHLKAGSGSIKRIHTPYIHITFHIVGEGTILLRHEIYLKCSILNAILKGQNCRPTSI